MHVQAATNASTLKKYTAGITSPTTALQGLIRHSYRCSGQSAEIAVIKVADQTLPHDQGIESFVSAH